MPSRPWLVLAVLLAVASPSPAGDAASPSLRDPEARALALKEVSENLVCQCSCNMILSECSHQACPFALPEREKILAELDAGRTKDEIIAAYIARFGPTIRATPPTRGSLYDRIAWYAPFLALALGFVVAVIALVRLTRRPGRRAETAVAASLPAGDDPYRRRVEAELQGRGLGETRP